MSGMVIRAVPVTQLDFSNVKASTEVSQRIAQHIDVSQFRFATMIVRLHEKNMVTGTFIKVRAFSDGYTLEDPSKLFKDTTTLGEISIADSKVPPFMETLDLNATKMGSMIMIEVAGVQPASTGALVVTISVDIAGKWE